MSASSLLVVVFMFVGTAQARGKSAMITNSNFWAFNFDFNFFYLTINSSFAFLITPKFSKLDQKLCESKDLLSTT